jgi:hypothetical protein
VVKPSVQFDPLSFILPAGGAVILRHPDFDFGFFTLVGGYSVDEP